MLTRTCTQTGGRQYDVKAAAASKLMRLQDQHAGELTSVTWQLLGAIQVRACR